MTRRSCPRSAARGGLPWCSSRHLPGELGRVDAAVHAELEEQPVAPGGRELGHEPQRVLVGVDVEEREVAVAQCDEVALRAEVRLHGDGAARARDLEAQV